MTKSLIYSLSFHAVMILLTVLSLPFMIREPVDLPPIISVELIRISDQTNIPYAPKARKVIEKAKEKEKRVVSEQAPPAAKAKEKPDRQPLPKKQNEKKKLVNKYVLIKQKWKIKDYYDKIHMFDVTLSKKERYFESKTFTAGNKIKSFNLPWGKLGLSICYDLRFPNLYRKLSKSGSIFISRTPS